MSLTNDVLIQFDNGAVSFIINKSTNVIQKVRIIKEEEQFLHTSVFQNKYKLIHEENYVSVVDIESQENIGIFHARPDEKIVDATFSIKGDYIVYISEQTNGKLLLYFRDFQPIQVLIDEVNLRYHDCELTETERTECYLD